jgi:hypothetical protein
LWNARDYPNSQILEIRPTMPLAGTGPLGWANGMLDFSPNRIEKLIAQGYADAKRTLEPLKATLLALRGLRASADIARAELAELDREFPGDTSEPTLLPDQHAEPGIADDLVYVGTITRAAWRNVYTTNHSMPPHHIGSR